MLPLTPWIHTVLLSQRKVRESNPQNILRRLLAFEASGPAGYAQTSQKRKRRESNPQNALRRLLGFQPSGLASAQHPQQTVGLKGVEPLIFPVSERGSTAELHASR